MGALELTKKTAPAQRRQVAIWLVVYMIIPMFLFALYFFSVTSDMRRNDLINRVSADTSEVSTRMDAVVRSVDRQVISATLDYNILEYLFNSSTDDGINKGYENYLMGIAKSIQSTQNAISSIYIFLGDKGVVALSGDVCPAEGFFDLLWMDYAGGLQHSNNVFTPRRTIVSPNGRKQDIISGIWAIRPQTYEDEISNFVVINFSVSKLRDVMSQSVSDAETLFVLNSSGQEIMGRSEELERLLRKDDYETFINHNVKGIYTGDNGDYIIASVVSTYADWTYVLFSELELPILPDSAQAVNMYINLMILMAVLFVPILYLYRRNYMRAESRVKASAFGGWNLQEDAGIEDIVTSLGYREFMILCVSLDETEQVGDVSIAEQLKKIGKAMERAPKPQGMPDATMIVKREGNEYILLCTNAEGGAKVEELAQWCRFYVFEKFERSVSIGMSQIHELSHSNIQMAVEEAKEALKYRFCVGAGSILSYEENVMVDHEYYYINDAKRSLITNSLINRQYAGAKEGIEAIIEELRMQKGIFYSNARIVLHMLLDIVISVMRIRKYQPAVHEKSFDEIYSEMNRCLTMDDAIVLVRDTLEVYKQCMEEELLTRENTDPVDIMLDYINKNYDKDIKLKMFVEKTHFSESHLSRMFKNCTGENYLSYLTKKRVEAAKHMLRETDMKVSEIAAALSFNDSKTFIRAFEKYEKVTPGRYRNNARMQSEE